MNFLTNYGKTMELTVFLWNPPAVDFAFEIAEDTLDFAFSRILWIRFF
jgi:hypothetical protein